MTLHGRAIPSLPRHFGIVEQDIFLFDATYHDNIAYRRSTITSADRIVVLQDGRIVDTGTHEDLLGRSEQYREMVRVQVGAMTELSGAGWE